MGWFGLSALQAGLYTPVWASWQSCPQTG